MMFSDFNEFYVVPLLNISSRLGGGYSKFSESVRNQGFRPTGKQLETLAKMCLDKGAIGGNRYRDILKAIENHAAYVRHESQARKESKQRAYDQYAKSKGLRSQDLKVSRISKEEAIRREEAFYKNNSLAINSEGINPDLISSGCSSCKRKGHTSSECPWDIPE